MTHEVTNRISDEELSKAVSTPIADTYEAVVVFDVTLVTLVSYVFLIILDFSNTCSSDS